MKPLVGIPCRLIPDAHQNVRFGVPATYTHAVDLAGGGPVLVPLQLDQETLKSIFARLDGLLLVGGFDIDPREFGEQVLPECGEIETDRDATELALTRWALDDSRPIFGICRGIQVLNVAAGGSLYQDIVSQLKTPLKHDYGNREGHVLAHKVELDSESRVGRLLGSKELEVNSLHHQSVKQIAPGLRVVGCAPDGVVEAIESVDDRFVVGVQFHPERMLDTDARMLRLFQEFVSSARRHGK